MENDSKANPDDKTGEKTKTHNAKHAANKVPDAGNKEKANYLWPAISAVLALLLFASVFSNFGSKSGYSDSPKVLSKDAFALQMKGFIEETNPQIAGEVTIENITEENGLYKFSVFLNGRFVGYPSYATKDGSVLFPQSINVTNVTKEVKEAKEAAVKVQEASKPQKSDVPKVQLFVMSQCPYGVQAENAIKPVLDALKGKISFELKFIANQNDDGTFSSLHGQPEVDENLRQVCAMNVYPHYMDYVICRNANIKGSDWQACATKSNMSVSLIKACAEGKEGEGLLAKNIKLANELGVGGSPTIKINSTDYRGQRTPDALLSAICSAFNNPPSECSKAFGTNRTQADEVPEGEGCGA